MKADVKRDWLRTRYILKNGTNVKLEKNDVDYAYLIEGKKISIFFDKTRSFKDTLIDLKVFSEQWKGRKYHKGFLEIAIEAYADITNRGLIPDDKNIEIEISGHSLGGALSSIFVDFLMDEGYSNIRHFSFGELSNVKRNKLIKLYRKDSILYTQGIDFFTYCNNLFYKHYGTLIKLSSRGSLKANHRYSWIEEMFDKN